MGGERKKKDSLKKVKGAEVAELADRGWKLGAISDHKAWVIRGCCFGKKWKHGLVGSQLAVKMGKTKLRGKQGETWC